MATAVPRTRADSAITTSGIGSGICNTPKTPPSAITIGNVIGSTQIAGTPSCAPQIPTATIAIR
jgi:hypothetical protein